MDPIRIEFTIPDLSLFIGFGLLVFAITAFLAISNHRKKFKRFANPLQWLAENYLWIVLPLGTLAIGFAVYEWIWQILPKVGEIITQLKPATQSPEDIRNLAYAIGALLAAVALSATIPFQLIKVWVNERLAKTTEQGHMTDRIAKAVEQLGAEKTIMRDGKQETVPNLEVRLGAIYALERIAQDSLRDHIPVMEILCAYVRHNSPAEDAPTYCPVSNEINRKSDGFDLEVLRRVDTIRIDIQAVLSVIGRRGSNRILYERDASQNTIKQTYRLDLQRCNLMKLNLSDLDLRFANMEFSLLNGANIAGSNLRRLNLREANLEEAFLFESDLTKAIVIHTTWRNANIVDVVGLRESDITTAREQGAER